MASVDDRIVGMRFDNAGFEQKMAETLKSLNKLQQSLDFSNSKRGMEDLSKAGKDFNMGGMGNAVEGISAKFAALATIGITALANITNRAIDAGIRMTKALTTDNIRAGFQEFELKMGSIQTIMAGSGADLATVNKKLQELNEYSDRTIYSFADMTQNIGKFTNAGVSLDAAVASIQGVANVAALSGANAGEASRAMYNFAQAISQGSVKLIDWKSIELANMGTVEFKQQLIDTAVAMGTLTKTSDGYVTSAGTALTATKGFNQSLTDEWLTSEALTTTLQKFSDTTTDIGKRATAAATDVKTFSQMIDTMKESVGSGWAQTFELIFGDFEEGKKLWTSINNAFGSIVGASADARNNLLSGWKELGGRDLGIAAIQDALAGLSSVLTPIQRAFREIFPPMTSQRLFELTQAFAKFTEKMQLSTESMDTVKRIFAGLFAAIEIGWTIVKGVAGLIGDVIGSLSGAAGGGLKFAASLGDAMVALNRALVDGGGIKRFFESLSEAIRNPGQYIQQLRENITRLVQTFPGFSAVAAFTGAVLERLGGRFEQVNSITKKAGDGWDALSSKLQAVGDVLGRIFGYIGEWLRGLGRAIAEAIKPGDFDTAIDAVNIGLLGGIILMFKKFMKMFGDMDFTGGILSKVTNALDGVTGSLKAMQADLRAKALMKIAAAVGILTISIVALSLINSEALARALTAIGIGFAQLIVVMGVMEKMSVGAGGLKIAALAAGMILLSTAMTILSIAVKNLSSLGWEELAKGLVGVIVALVALTTSTKLIAADTAGLIRAGVAMTIMAVALNAMALAVKSFAELSFGDLVKGLIGVGVGLGIIVTGMNLMPAGPGMIAAGAGMVAVAVGLRILAEAVQAFGGMSMMEMGKGFIAVAAGLVIIAAAMHLMPPGMALMAVGLLGVSTSLAIMAGALLIFSTMSLPEIAKGLLALAGTLAILAVSLNLMTGTVTGAAAVVVVSGALLVLAGVMKILGNMSLWEIAKGLGAIAAVLIVLGVAAAVLTPVIPALYSLGAAIALLGAGFALFGVGAMLVAKAFELLAKAGLVGVNVLIEVIKRLIAVLPELVGAFVKEIGELASEFGMVAALLAKTVTVLFSHILDGIIELAPKIAKAFVTIIKESLMLVREVIPDVVETGIAIILAFLRGIRDNANQIVTTAVEVITNFATTLSNNAQKLVDAAVKLLFAFTTAIGNRANEIVAAGLGLLVSFIQGISNNLQRVTDAVSGLITRFITSVGSHVTKVVAAGAKLIIDIITGIGDKSGEVVTAGTKTIIKFIEGLGKNAIELANAAAKTIIKFINGLTEAINTYAPQLREAGRKLAFAIVDGATLGLASKAKGLADKASGIFKGAIGAVKGVVDSKSPSKVFFGIGEDMIAGSVLAFSRDTSLEKSATNLADRTVSTFRETLAKIPDTLGDMNEFHPVITPVLDLTKVRASSQGLNSLIGSSLITPSVSFDQAHLISTTNELENAFDDSPSSAGPTEIKFEQNNYSPQALTVNDIYRNTKSQIALAKEELNIS